MDLRLVIFDCDGVLVDSEGISEIILRETAQNFGVAYSHETAKSFRGRRWSDLQKDFEFLCGADFGSGWPLRMQENLLTKMRKNGLPRIEGAYEAILAVRAQNLPYRIASNSSRAEMAGKFALAGFTELTKGRYHSSAEAGRGKPAPDVYLAAASAEGVLPAHCLAIEDSLPGVTAALAAGMRCLALESEETRGMFAPLGAEPIASMRDFPEILGGFVRGKAA
jgi:HAD superfamily hydrolase (TIGR01509 family)